MKHQIYVLQSLKDKKFYIGLSKNPPMRLRDHNLGTVKSTKGRRPFKIVYTEICLNRVDARKKEKYYKSGIGREKLKESIPL